MSQYIAPIIILIALIVVAIYFFSRKSTNNNDNNRSLVASDESAVATSNTDIMSVQFDLIPEISDEEAGALVPIKDKKLVARIESCIPKTLQTVQDADAAKKMKDLLKEGEHIYQAIIPAGAKLDKSREMEGAFRATYREVKNSIEGAANLKPVDSAAAASAAANVTNAVMNVGSMVVGQYYMAQISSELDALTSNVNQIRDFQNSEFKSKVAAILMEVQKISSFEVEFLENEEQRKIKIKELGEYEHEVIQLLNQVNDQMNGITKKTDVDYKTYEERIKELNRLYEYQYVLMKCLHSIDELTYTFNLGKVSERTCFEHFTRMAGFTDKSVDKLRKWHEGLVEKFDIDTEEEIRARRGLEKWAKPLTIFDRSWNYKDIPSGVASMISKQSQDTVALMYEDHNELFDQDVRIVIKDSQYYYLPQINNQ